MCFSLSFHIFEDDAGIGGIGAAKLADYAELLCASFISTRSTTTLMNLFWYARATLLMSS